MLETTRVDARRALTRACRRAPRRGPTSAWPGQADDEIRRHRPGGSFFL